MKKINLQARHHCLNIIEEKLENYQSDLAYLQQSANEETKSSMGDKYETGRSMVQQEINKLSGRLAELDKLRKMLQMVSGKNTDKVSVGSFVKCDRGNYYVAVSLGQLKMKNLEFIAISQATPLAQKMIGLGPGDHFELNKSKYRIIDVIN